MEGGGGSSSLVGSVRKGPVLAKEPEKIGSLIQDSIAKMGYADRLRKQSAVLRWSEIAGSIIAAESEAVRVDGDTLVVKVHRAAWRQQLVFLKAEILAQIERKIGKGYIRDIRFI